MTTLESQETLGIQTSSRSIPSMSPLTGRQTVVVRCSYSHYYHHCEKSNELTTYESPGAFIVMPHNQFGKLPEGYPLCAGHGGPVLDTDWNPFNDNIIASGSEDSRVMIWKIPEGGLTETLTTPEVTLEGHQRKVGFLSISICVAIYHQFIHEFLE